MRHNKKTVKLGRVSAPRKALMKNLIESLILRESIQTTEAKAKALRPLVEKLITKAKKGGLHNYRLVLSRLYTENTAKKLFEVVGPRYTERAGGYTRILKIGARRGDAAQIVQIELV